MKKHLYILMVLACLFACEDKANHKVGRTETVVVENPQQIGHAKGLQEQTRRADGKYPVITFDQTVHDFKDIEQGDKVTHEFTFENTGDADLVISDAYGSCGCTVPEFPKHAVKPGETGKIKVTFDSAGKLGRQQKNVTLVTNTASTKEQLQIKVNINPGN